jgi:tripartite-type tricarboxylate transporter receptor subunit TctC
MNRKLMIKTKAWLFLSCLLSAFICSFAHSQNYPSKAIRLVVPYAPGGGLDVFNRPMSIKLSELISQPVVIDNKAGASGVIGADVVAKSPADGYTLLTAFSSQILQPFVLKNVPFDNQKDFTPILEAARAPIVIVVNPSLPVYSMAELINYEKNNPGKVGYVTAGTNTSQHLTGLMLEKITGTPLIHISYKGGGPALTDLLGGQVQMGILVLGPIMQQIQAGKLRPLAVIESTRAKAAPNVPTLEEAGFGGATMPDTWIGYFGPKGLSSAQTKQINALIQQASQAPEVRSKLESAGYEVMGGTPEQFKDKINLTYEHYKRLVALAGLQAQ